MTPSAKYCCSGSLLRLAKGSTTIDKRGATAGSVTDGAVCAISEVVPTAAGSVGEDLVNGQSHQAMTAITSAPAAAAAIARGAARRRRGAVASTLVAGNSAMASGRNKRRQRDLAAHARPIPDIR